MLAAVYLLAFVSGIAHRIAVLQDSTLLACLSEFNGSMRAEIWLAVRLANFQRGELAW